MKIILVMLFFVFSSCQSMNSNKSQNVDTAQAATTIYENLKSLEKLAKSSKLDATAISTVDSVTKLSEDAMGSVKANPKSVTEDEKSKDIKDGKARFEYIKKLSADLAKSIKNKDMEMSNALISAILDFMNENKKQLGLN